MNRTGIIFCTVSLLATLVVFAAMIPASMVSKELAATASSCKTLSDDIEVEFQGILEDISIWDLIRYYLENPPAPGAVSKAQRFGGC